MQFGQHNALPGKVDVTKYNASVNGLIPDSGPQGVKPVAPEALGPCNHVITSIGLRKGLNNTYVLIVSTIVCPYLLHPPISV